MNQKYTLDKVRITPAQKKEILEQYPNIAPKDSKANDAVFSSNMSKLDENGNVIRHPETGKVLKGKNFFKPDLSKLLNT